MTEDQIFEEQIADMTPEQQYEMLMQHLQGSIDPLEYLTPGQREIAMLTETELQTEYELVQSKQSARSRAQRDMIMDRWQYEQNVKQTQNTEQ